jgi:hypothetical protein
VALFGREEQSLISFAADSYTWVYIFNYFNDLWQWKSTGEYTWEKDELKRDWPNELLTSFNTTVNS